jgi:hypothetical protein
MGSRSAVLLAGVMLPAAAIAQTAAPPTIDCAVGFDGLKTAARSLPGARIAEDRGFEVVTLEAPDAWRVEIAFTTSWHAAHPAATLRTLRKQVTGVWTADSKSCGYGDQAAFVTLVADMKAGDKALTDASRAEIEQRKQSQSPLAPAH